MKKLFKNIFNAIDIHISYGIAAAIMFFTVYASFNIEAGLFFAIVTTVLVTDNIFVNIQKNQS